MKTILGHSESDVKRFLKFVMPDCVIDCIVWVGHRDRGGYGRFQMGDFCDLAHRFSYRAWNGPIPSGMEIDHLCRNRWCVNPEHLEAVTGTVNIMRGVGVTAQNAKKTHCKHGHEFTAKNTYVYTIGGHVSRYCRACRKAADSTHRATRTDADRAKSAAYLRAWRERRRSANV